MNIIRIKIKIFSSEIEFSLKKYLGVLSQDKKV
jgi:hypothetical protein